MILPSIRMCPRYSTLKYYSLHITDTAFNKAKKAKKAKCIRNRRGGMKQFQTLKNYLHAQEADDDIQSAIATTILCIAEVAMKIARFNIDLNF